MNDDKIFLLSAEEVTNELYGFNFVKHYPSTSSGNSYAYIFDGNDKLKMGSSTGSGNHWWLRSACSYGTNTVAGVNSSGYSNYDPSSYSYAVRFALNVHLASVITSEASSSASATGASEASTFKAIGDSSNSTASPRLYLPQVATAKPTVADAYKLTIASGTAGSSFKITSVETKETSGGNLSLSIKYTGATSGHNVCAILKRLNTAGTADYDAGPHYFARKNSISGTSGTVEFSIPSGIEKLAKYKLIAYDEDFKEGQKTSIAKYDIWTSDTIAPTVTNVYTNEAKTWYKLTASDSSGLSTIDKVDSNSTPLKAIWGK